MFRREIGCQLLFPLPSSLPLTGPPPEGEGGFWDLRGGAAQMVNLAVFPSGLLTTHRIPYEIRIGGKARPLLSTSGISMVT